MRRMAHMSALGLLMRQSASITSQPAEIVRVQAPATLVTVARGQWIVDRGQALASCKALASLFHLCQVLLARAGQGEHVDAVSWLISD